MAKLFTSSDIEVLAPLPQGYEEWAERLKTAARTYRQSQWQIGDLLNEGDRRFPEFWSQASAETGLTEITLKNCMWVARAIDKSRRRDSLSFSAHMEVAKLGPLEQDKLLSQAVEQGWRSKDLRARIKAAEAGDKTAFTPEWQPQPRLSSQTVDETEPLDDDEKPVMDSGAVGEALSAERYTPQAGDSADGFDQISKIAGQIGKLTPDLRHRLWRMCINADDASVIHELFPQSLSRVEPTASLSKAPCDASAAESPVASTHAAISASGGTPSTSCADDTPSPVHETPATPLVSGNPDTGGGSIQEPELPDYLRRSKEAVS